MFTSLAILLLVSPVGIQSKPPSSPRPQVDNRQGVAPEDESRRRGIEILEDVAGQLIAIESNEMRSLIRGQIADLMWEFNTAKGRTQLSEAVASMVTFLSSSSDKPIKISERSASPRGAAAVRLLRITLKRDPVLAKSLSDALSDTSRSASEKGSQLEKTQLAFNVLDADPKFSMELAGDTIGDSPVSSSFISYLSQLRAKDPSLAKELFTKALSPALASQQWARSVGNLALYALPGFGDARMRAGMGLDDAANTDRTSGDALLKGVCQKVSDLLKAPEKTSPSLAGLNAVILLRLHPYFKNQLTSCAETVHAAADEMMRLAPNDQMREQITKSARSQSKDDLLSSASTTGSKAEQDQLYLQALLQLISEERWEEALGTSQLLNREESRAIWKRTISFKAAQAMIARKEIDQAVAYSNALQNPDDIAAVYSNVFDVLVEDGDVNRAWEMLSRGKDLVANGSKAQQPTALLTLALAALKVKPAMGFELARAAIISLNRAYESKEKDDKQYSNAALKLEASMLLFGKVDFEQGLGLAGLIVDKTLSMQSTIEVCRSVIVRQQGRHSAK